MDSSAHWGHYGPMSMWDRVMDHVVGSGGGGGNSGADVDAALVHIGVETA